MEGDQCSSISRNSASEELFSDNSSLGLLKRTPPLNSQGHRLALTKKNAVCVCSKWSFLQSEYILAVAHNFKCLVDLDLVKTWF